MASHPEAETENKEIAKAATSDNKWAALVNIVRLFALIPPTTSTAMKRKQIEILPDSFHVDGDRASASLELVLASKKHHAAPAHTLLPPLFFSVVCASSDMAIG